MTKPQDTPGVSDTTNDPSPRKPYKKPELQAYGDLAALTQGLNSGGQNDGSGHPNKHFTS